MAFAWSDLLAQIPFRLNRPDLPADFVLEMVAERIDFYGPQLFYPAEVTNYDIVTQPGQFFYRLPAGCQQVNFVRVLYNGVWIPVPMPAHYTDILTVDPLQPPFTSLPVSLAKVYGSQLRLFPTPDAQYPVELTMLATVPAPTDDNDTTNFWVTDGRMLLINSTMLEICTEYLDLAEPNSVRIQHLAATTQQCLEQLMSQAHARTAPFVMKQHL